MDYIWGTSIVETCLRMIIDLWELRNKEVHGKEEATKQKKRKDKAAISVRALHDLEEIARPSDSFLFYQDVEQEIEQVTTVVKLEGCITMKTRPIHNSVKKWAKRVRSEVKLIIGWIKTGGKNNREIIERVEKQQRDHFQHKAHTKTEKENRRKGQYRILHHETNISVWSYIPKEQLVLISEGTLISIPLAGIKHYVSCCCKSDLHFSVESSENVTMGL